MTAIMLVLVTVLVLFPLTASAASKTFYMFVGQQGTMSITANQVPNAKWKTSNSSVLKIVKQSPSSVTTKGMKAGTSNRRCITARILNRNIPILLRF